MGRCDYQHKALAAGKWAAMPLSQQHANIGSEVFRAIKWKNKGNTVQEQRAAVRALELIDITIEGIIGRKPVRKGALKEMTRNREILCDYFFGENEFSSNDESLIKYFDQFEAL